jgi:hypothetical protein
MRQSSLVFGLLRLREGMIMDRGLSVAEALALNEINWHEGLGKLPEIDILFDAQGSAWFSFCAFPELRPERRASPWLRDPSLKKRM